jgi:hypothetical protein
MRPHGRVLVSATTPRAQAVCDRCGFWWNHDQLQFQYEWNATSLYNTGALVCRSCLDRPNQQLRTIILPPDPLPVLDARTEPFAKDELGPTVSQIAWHAARGAWEVFVKDAILFAIGDLVYVQMNNGAFAAEIITAIDPSTNKLIISIPLPYSASPLGIVTTANYISAGYSAVAIDTVPVRIVTVPGPITILPTDEIVVVDKDVGEPTTINLLPDPATGDELVIKDGRGDAGTNNITIVPAAGTVDGLATYVMTFNWQAVTLVYSGTEWIII